MNVFNEVYEDDDFDEIFRLLEDSDDDEVQRGGLRAERAPNIERGRVQGAALLHADYFSDNPTYPEHMFFRRFRVSRSIFVRICEKLEATYPFFQMRKDAAGKSGFNVYQKCTAAIRQMAYGTSADAVDEYLRMGDSTARDCLKKFAYGVVECFKHEYLRPPNGSETKILLQRASALNFPGMLGSIDCCKWKWKNCPTAYHGQYRGKEKVPTITMEAIADDRLYYWHAFFGVAGCNNDITVLEASPLLSKISTGTYPLAVEFDVGTERVNKPYWLCDGIYPKYPCFLHSILNPVGDDESYFAGRQEGRRKDIERAFGVLQAKWHILAVPSRLWKTEDMRMIIYCCVILHNIVVEELRPLVELTERNSVANVRVGDAVEYCFERCDISRERAIPGTIAAVCATERYLRSATAYLKLRRLIFDVIVSERNRYGPAGPF